MRHCFFILSIVIIFLSCSKKEDPIEREKKEMKLFFDDSKLLVPYKGVKIALRTDYENTSEKNSKIGATGLQTFSTISKLIMKDSVPQGVTGVYDTYKTIKGLYELKKEINAINEDELPTIFDRLAAVEQSSSHNTNLSASIEKNIFGSYNNSTEHFLLGSIWFVIPSAPADVYVYEAAQINENDISKPDQHLFASLLKALVCEQKKWHYTSEKSSSEYINYITTHKQDVLHATDYLDSVPGASAEKRFYELRSVGYALRGYARQNSGREKEANEDFDAFVDDFAKSAVQNKDLCFLSAYLCIKNNKPEKAEVFLAKMEKLNNFTENDKQTVTELRGFIKDKNGEAFNKYFDSFSLGSIAFSYIYQVSVKSEMAKQLKNNKLTRIFVAIPQKVNRGLSESTTLINADSLINNASSLVKDLFK